MVAITELLNQLENMSISGSYNLFKCEPGFNDEQKSFFMRLRLTLLEINQELADLKKNKPVQKLDNSFVAMVLNKIQILKNIIKKSTGDENGEFFSMNLTNVESIEADIRQTGSVSQAQMKKLNEIYKNVNI